MWFTKTYKVSISPRLFFKLHGQKSSYKSAMASWLYSLNSFGYSSHLQLLYCYVPTIVRPLCSQLAIFVFLLLLLFFFRQTGIASKMRTKKSAAHPKLPQWTNRRTDRQTLHALMGSKKKISLACLSSPSELQPLYYIKKSDPSFSKIAAAAEPTAWDKGRAFKLLKAAPTIPSLVTLCDVCFLSSLPSARPNVSLTISVNKIFYAVQKCRSTSFKALKWRKVWSGTAHLAWCQQACYICLYILTWILCVYELQHFAKKPAKIISWPVWLSYKRIHFISEEGDRHRFNNTQQLLRE